MTELLLLCDLREEDLEPIAARRALLAASKRSDAGTVFSSETANAAPESNAAAAGADCTVEAAGRAGSNFEA
jgi:hypothetical protein